MREGRRRYIGSTSATTVALLLASSCHSGGLGTASVVASCTTGCDSITQATVTVSKGEGSSFTPIVAVLSQSGAQWIATVTKIPAGDDREFQALAYNASQQLVASGSGMADITADAETAIFITLSAQSPSTGPPIIDSVSASPDEVPTGGKVALQVSAHDPNPNYTLSYLWNGTCGTFDNPTLTNPVWTAPSQPTGCQLVISVTDNHGQSTNASLLITVINGTGSVIVVGTVPPPPPVIVSFTGQVTLGPTTTGTLQVVATDTTGNPLSYVWSSTCAGLSFDFTAPFSETKPYFTAPAPVVPCGVTVTVSDVEAGTTTSGTLTIAPYAP